VNNQLITLEGIEKCEDLRFLSLHNNQLKTLEGLEKFVNLQVLDYGDNLLETLTGLKTCVNLHRNSKNFKENVVFKTVNSLNLFVQLGKEIHSISSLETKFYRNFVSLRRLGCEFNRLKTFEGLENCMNLQELYCHGNLLDDNIITNINNNLQKI
jgi:hypothetical protein